MLRLHESRLACLTPPEGGGRGVLGRWAAVNAPAAWLRRRVGKELRAIGEPVTLLYNAWGADLLAEADPAKVRLGFLHNHFPELEKFLAHFSGWLDGFVSVSAQMDAAVRRAVPAAMRERCTWVPVPVENVFFEREFLPREPVIGLCGRLAREQKRVDRLPELLARLRQSGRPHRVEVLGDGPDRAWLEREVGGGAVFHGWRPAAEAARIMRRWRHAVFLSDYEGQSIALLEAAASGCVPLYPDFHGGVELPAGAAGACLYPRGDMAELAARWAALEAMGEEGRAGVRTVLREWVAGHTEARHRERLAKCVAELAGRVDGMRRERRAAGFSGLKPIWSYNRFYRGLTGT